MHSLRRIRGSVSGGMLVSLLWFTVSTAPAEVGVSLSGDAASVNYYEVKSIIDDPEPVGIVWAAYNSTGPNRVILNPEGEANGDGEPSSLATQAGFPAVVWSKNSPGGYDVVLSTFVGDAWTAPAVLAGTAEDELDPVLVEDPSNGAVHLLYWVLDGSPRVMHRQAPADLSSWTAAVQVSQPGELAARPSAVFHEGELHVAYEVHDLGYGSTPRQIVLATWDGQVFLSEMVAMTGHAEPNWAGVHSAEGTLWIDWIDAPDEMMWARQTSPGVWDPVQCELFETTEERDYHVRAEIELLALQ